MSAQTIDWESIYREQGEFEGPPPWNIGEPQPELAALIAAGKFRSDVLDAGCGVAELSLDLAAQGFTVVGIDLAPTAVAAATKAAAERGLTTATFARADITDFSGYPPGSEERFATVVDSTLFHSLPVEERDGYLRSIHRAASSGAGLFVLVFAKGAFPENFEPKPNEVDEDELRAAVSKYWEIDEIRPAYIHANIPPAVDGMSEFPPHDHDEKGRMKLPAYLLTAHKAG
jgi:SAM-dependent methyltransferase